MAKDFMWYIVSTFVGSECNVAENIRQTVKNNNLENIVSKVIIPTQIKKCTNKKKSQDVEKTTNKVIYPGYVFVNMIADDNAFKIIRYVNGVRGIGGVNNGSSGCPQPVSLEEMDSVFKRMGQVSEGMYANYKIGDFIKIINGPLRGSGGKIISIDANTGICEIEMVFFGKLVPTQVDFVNIEKDIGKK